MKSTPQHTEAAAPGWPVSASGLPAFRGYTVTRLIGVGGVGLVYEARQKATGQRVAIKVLRPELAGSAFAAHLFWREARHMRRLAHPHVLPVCEISEGPLGPFLVTPYIERGSLAGALGDGKPLPVALTLRWVRQIAEALAQAHRRGVIHGDVKPANVLVNEKGDVLLADFGFACAALNDSMVGLPDAICAGTRPYLSPAVAAGEVEDTRRDIYALGVLLYQMLTGQLPKTGEAATVAKGLALNPGVPPGLVAIALAAMAPAQRDRYANADDLLADLQRVEAGKEPLGPHGQPASGWDQQLSQARAAARRWPRPVRVLLAAGMLIAILAGGLLAVWPGLRQLLLGANRTGPSGALRSQNSDRSRSAVRAAALASPTATGRGWGRMGYDLAATYSNPWASKLNVGQAPFKSHWSVPVQSAYVYTGDVNGDGRLELVLSDGTNTFLYGASGQRLLTIERSGGLGLLADVDGDGRVEILTTDSTHGIAMVRAYGASGKPLKAYMMGGQKLPFQTIITVHGVVDLDGDGQTELVVFANGGYQLSREGLGSQKGSEGAAGQAPEADKLWFRRVALFDTATGRQLGFYDVGPFPTPPVSFGDLNLDRCLDMVFGCQAPRNGKTGADGSSDAASYVWALDGRAVSLWRRQPFDGAAGLGGHESQMRAALLWRCGPLNAGGFFDSTAKAADLNNDQVPEVVVTAFGHAGDEVGRLLVLNPASGTPLAGFERDFGRVDVQVAAVADLNPGGYQEILIVSQMARKLWALESSSGLEDWRVFEGRDAVPWVQAVNDIDGDGFLEVIVALGQRLCVLNHDLSLRWEWGPSDDPADTVGAAVVSDLDGDGINEIIVCSRKSVDVLHAPQPER